MNFLSTTAAIDEAFTTAISQFFGGLFSIMAIGWILGILFLFAIVAAITWIVKKVWNAGTNKTQKQSKQHNQWTDDWVYNASARQNNRYEYSDPVKTPKWTYNERARMWVDEDQLEQERHKRAYEENRRKWQAYEAAEAKKEEERQRAREVQNEIERHQKAVMAEINKPIYLTPEEQELAKQIRVERNGPTFEEWKAAREQEGKS